MKINYKNLIIFIILLVTEVIIGAYVHDKIIRPFVGDILVVGVIYFFLRSFIKQSKPLPILVFIFACLVEFAQYFNVVSILHLENIKIAKIILGATFDLGDILCYFIGTILVYIYEILTKYLTRNKNR